MTSDPFTFRQVVVGAVQLSPAQLIHVLVGGPHCDEFVSPTPAHGVVGAEAHAGTISSGVAQEKMN